jgi:DNA-directed RNA polymerase subunit RPC12/RpoP
MELVELGQIRRLVLAHKDRLVRFGYGYFEAFCQRHNTEIIVMNGQATSSEQELVSLDERNTSKACSTCGQWQSMPLYKRTYRCTECGLVMDRDENSAVNILQRYFAQREPHTGDPVRCADVFTATEYV